ncbi:MAG TPA: DUF6152 family protein [Terriglobia bacterium]|jgi:hypothetical protein|nr:DUF6152 family protein [Terriglobia bacterium]
MKLRIFAASVLVVGLLASSQVRAHHSFAATYLEDRTMQIEGKLVQFQFRNPHSFIHLEVKDEKGTVVRWAVEWGGAAQLGSQGVTGETLKYGDVVSIIGNPGRVPEDHRIRMLSLRRKSDNFGWGQRPGEVVN